MVTDNARVAGADRQCLSLCLALCLKFVAHRPLARRLLAWLVSRLDQCKRPDAAWLACAPTREAASQLGREPPYSFWLLRGAAAQCRRRHDLDAVRHRAARDASLPPVRVMSLASGQLGPADEAPRGALGVGTPRRERMSKRERVMRS